MQTFFCSLLRAERSSLIIKESEFENLREERSSLMHKRFMQIVKSGTFLLKAESGSFRPWVVSAGRFALGSLALVLWVGRFALIM